MSTIMLCCPETGQPFSVGLETDEASFKALPSVEATAHCPHCGKDHAWSKSNAWLASPLPRTAAARGASSPRAVVQSL
jgi:hypothetical protein